MRPANSGVPQPVDVRGRGVDPAVAVAAHRQVEHVRAQPVVVEVADGGAAGQFVGSQEFRVGHSGRPADALVDQIMERHSRGPLGEQGQHHVSAVAVVEPLTGLVLHRVTVQHGEELLGGRQLVDRHGHDVVVVVVQFVLVEVVADAGAVSEELLDGDAVVDQRQVVRRAATGRSCPGRAHLVPRGSSR